MKKRRPQIIFVFGTRPEVIKLAPVILTLKKNKNIKVTLISVGQHDQLLNESLAAFNLKAQINLKIMKHGQTISEIVSRAFFELNTVFASLKAKMTIVVGDTASAFAAAVVSSYHQIPVVHIEAGARTDKFYEPFPEEINRRLISAVTLWHFPSTKKMKNNLIREHINKKNIFLFGSTEIDALNWILENTSGSSIKKTLPQLNTTKSLIIITLHRRESWGAPMKQVFSAIKHIARKHSHIQFIYSTHPNPLIADAAVNALSRVNNVIVVSHIAPVPFMHLVNKSSLIMTDSGGIQLQAGALLKPVLILRNVTEWPELIECGIGRLVGTNKKTIVAAFEDYMSKKWPKKLPNKSIYQKGAADKIAKIIFSKILT